VLTLDRTTRHRHPLLVLAAMLGLAVFLWGLQYKLSLYHSVTIHHATPKAKLLSQRERPVPSGGIERHLVFGKHILVASLYFFHGAAVALICSASFDLSARYVESIEPQPNPIAERLRHHSLWSPRGPPIAI
jgi:hypothetical protein